MDNLARNTEHVAIPTQSEMTVKQKYIQSIHHNDDNKCWITVAEKNKQGFTQWHYKYLDLLAGAEEIVPKNDGYISINAFYMTYRRIEYLRQLNYLYLDLDIYKVNMSKQQALWEIDAVLMGDDVPYPSKIIDSGNGLYLLWELKRTPSKALPLWNALQRFLYEKFKHVGADKAALDCTRVLRVVDTNNTKNNNILPVWERYSQQVWGPYTLRELQEKYLPVLTPYTDTKKKIAPKRGRKPNIVRLFKEETLCYYRTLDFIKLCELRKWDMRGCREHILFLYRIYSIQVFEDNERALEAVLELNSQFLEPLPEREATRATRSAEKKQYKYKNETIIELLDISMEEQKHMLITISEDEIKRRNNENHKKSRRNENGLTIREQTKLDTFKQVKELYEKGLKQVEIVQITGLTKGRVSQIVKEIKLNEKV